MRWPCVKRDCDCAECKRRNYWDFEKIVAPDRTEMQEATIAALEWSLRGGNFYKKEG